MTLFLLIKKVRHCWYTELLMLSCECAMSVRLWILFPFQSHDEEGILSSSRRYISLLLKMDIWCLQQLANKQHGCCSAHAAPHPDDDRPFYAFISQIAKLQTLLLCSCNDRRRAPFAKDN